MDCHENGKLKAPISIHQKNRKTTTNHHLTRDGFSMSADSRTSCVTTRTAVLVAWVAVFLFVAAAPVPVVMMKTTPAAMSVFLFRHGECYQPACGTHLCTSGISRARFLPSLFANTRRLKPPCKLYAINPGKPPFMAREYETFIPLAIARNISINTSFARGDEQTLANAILGDLDAGAVVAVSWRHTMIGAVATALGCTANMSSRCVAGSWPNLDFDTFVHMKFQRNYNGTSHHHSSWKIVNASTVHMGFTPVCDTPNELSHGACTELRRCKNTTQQHFAFD